MLARLNQPALPKDTIRAMVGKGMANLVRRALAAAQGSPPTPGDEARALALYETDYERVLGRETVVFPGVREGLERLASAGFGLACVTNKTNRFVRPHLAQAGLGAYFSLIIGGDTLAGEKTGSVAAAARRQAFLRCAGPPADARRFGQRYAGGTSRGMPGVSACLTATTRDGPCKASIAMV